MNKHDEANAALGGRCFCMYICYLLKIHALPLCWSLSECSSSMYCAICEHLSESSVTYGVAS